MMMPAHENKILGRITLDGREARLAAWPVIGCGVDMANLRDNDRVGQRCARRDDRVSTSRESALIP